MIAECQVCGRPAAGEGTVEGARVPLCERCSDYASNFAFYKEYLQIIQQAKPSKLQSSALAKPAVKPSEEVELVEDFGKRIMQAREKRGLSRKEFAKKLLIQEKQLEGFEQQKFKPPAEVITKLEFALGIKLTEAPE